MRDDPRKPPRDGGYLNDLDAVLRDALRVRLLRRMGGVIQHDLKSPIQGVSWSLDLAQRAAARPDVDAGAREQVQKAVAMARNELARLERNVRGLLADAGVLGDEHETFDLAQLVRELARHFVTEAAMRELQLGIALPESLVAVHGPRAEVARALLVCLLDAFDALPKGGRVEVRLSFEDEDAAVQILDDGPAGAPPEEYSLAGLGRRLTAGTLGAFGGRMHTEERARPWRQATCVRLPLAAGAASAAARGDPVEESL